METGMLAPPDPHPLLSLTTAINDEFAGKGSLKVVLDPEKTMF
jgi:hypothetical protein